jgi:hypothetical protein
MSQPATSPFEGLADLLQRNYSTGFMNMQLPGDWGPGTGDLELASSLQPVVSSGAIHRQRLLALLGMIDDRRWVVEPNLAVPRTKDEGPKTNAVLSSLVLRP